MAPAKDGGKVERRWREGGLIALHLPSIGRMREGREKIKRRLSEDRVNFE
jgi:hypothetical protein